MAKRFSVSNSDFPRPAPALSAVDKAEKLRTFGFHSRLYRSKKQSPQLKGAATRLYAKHAHFLNPGPDTSPSKFFKLSKTQRRLAKKTLSSQSLTPGGVWLQVPKGIKPADYTIRVEKDAVIEEIKGKQFDRILPLKRGELLRSPVEAFQAVFDREKARAKRLGIPLPKQAQLVVNGFQGKRVQSIKAMQYYLTHNPRFLEEIDELDEEEIEDTFQVKFIYPTKASTRGKKHTQKSTQKLRRRRR
jgi:hypothetical protein